jgi:hypothetical protein
MFKTSFEILNGLWCFDWPLFLMIGYLITIWLGYTRGMADLEKDARSTNDNGELGI